MSLPLQARFTHDETSSRVGHYGHIQIPISSVGTEPSDSHNDIKKTGFPSKSPKTSPELWQNQSDIASIRRADHASISKSDLDELRRSFETLRMVQQQHSIARERHTLAQEKLQMNVDRQKNSHEGDAASQAELVIGYRTRIALLEADLKRRDDELQSSRSNLLYLIATLAKSPSASDRIITRLGTVEEELRAQVEDLKKENAKLKETVGHQELFGQTERTHLPNLASGSDSPAFGSFQGKSNAGSNNHDLSFSSSTSTSTFNTAVITSRNEQSTALTNIGMYSLEESFNEGFPAAIEATKLALSNNFKKEEEEEKTFDQQIQDYGKATQAFQNIPKPGVMKTGVRASGVRGREYDAGEDVGYKSTGRCHGFIGQQVNGWRNDRPPANFGAYEDLKKNEVDLSLWESADERDMAIDQLRDSVHEKDFSIPSANFWKHSLVYHPDLEDNNLFRAVHIGNLPADIQLRDVLDRVRGGRIVKAILLNFRGANSIIVTFVRESQAQEFVAHAKSYPLSFSEESGKKIVEVTLIPTPTYPMTTGLVNSLSHNATRCLHLPNFPTDFSLTRLEQNLACGNKYRAESLVEMFFTPEKTLHLQFSSINAAGSAFGILRAWRTYKGLEVHYEEDPCAGPVEELLQEATPRKPLFPKEGFSDGTPASINAYRDTESGIVVTNHFENMERKRLTALDNQRVEIPDFSGKNLISKAWADDSDDSDASVAKSPRSAESSLNTTVESEKLDVQDITSALRIDGINLKMAGKDRSWIEAAGLQKPPVGLQGSKFATLPFPSEAVKNDQIRDSGVYLSQRQTSDEWFDASEELRGIVNGASNHRRSQSATVPFQRSVETATLVPSRPRSHKASIAKFNDSEVLTSSCLSRKSEEQTGILQEVIHRGRQIHRPPVIYSGHAGSTVTRIRGRSAESSISRKEKRAIGSEGDSNDILIVDSIISKDGSGVSNPDEIDLDLDFDSETSN